MKQGTREELLNDVEANVNRNAARAANCSSSSAVDTRHEDVQLMPVKDMKALITSVGLSFTDCSEKPELQVCCALCSVFSVLRSVFCGAHAEKSHLSFLLCPFLVLS
jgi:hypothetical protein